MTKFRGIVEKILNERVEQDSDMQDVAYAVAKQSIKNIKQKDFESLFPSQQIELDEENAILTRVQLGADVLSITFDWAEASIRARKNGSYDLEKNINIYVNDFNDIFSKKTQSVLIHEITHFLDYTYREINFKEPSDNDTQTDYYNRPDELNARFVQIANRLYELIVENPTRKRFTAEMPSLLVMYILQEEDWIKKLDEYSLRNRRKLFNRLVRYSEYLYSKHKEKVNKLYPNEIPKFITSDLNLNEVKKWLN